MSFERRPMNSSMTARLAENLQRIHARMDAACDRSGRSRTDVKLIAVTKYAELDWVRGLIELGVRELGESRPQQMVSRSRQLTSEIHWHLIGHLQRNKVEMVLPVTSLLHSVDSVRLVEAVAAAGRKQQSLPRVLLEVNVSGEDSKDGFAVEQLLDAWPRILALESVTIDGLMTMAPLSGDREAARPIFRALRELRDRLRDLSGGGSPLPELSMGMSGDFEIGIEEGATLIRVGSSLFEGLETIEPGLTITSPPEN